jgi:uncharacterized membrane protein YeaQ/YmgE (transglycosylase-associated protein family)
MSGESIIVILVVGLIAGWLAGIIMRGWGFGLVGNIGIGVIGALIASWLLPKLGIRLGTGLAASIVSATIGAMIFILLFGLINRRGRWR